MKFFSVFSGCGGFELGIEKAYADFPRREGNEKETKWEGLEGVGDGLHARQFEHPRCVGLSEIDKHASAVLKHRFPDTTNYGDIEKIRWDKVPDFDLLVGGSPCQDFSIAGKRAGLDGARSGLFAEYVRALEEKRPEHFIWENVKGVLSSRGGWDFANMLCALAEAGYALWWQVLNAKDFGVPQNRERIFVVGTRTGSPREVFFERRDDSQAIKQLARSGATQADRFHSPTGLSPTGLSPTVPTAGGGRHIPMIQVKEATKQGYAEATVGDSINLSVPDSTTPRGRVGHGIANTLDTAMMQHTLSPDARIRRLTPTECERLMSWPDDHTKYGDYGNGKQEISDTQRYKMCGNGVVSAVVAEIIRAHFL